MKCFALALVISLAAGHEAGAKCARTENTPKLLTPDGAKLPDDGGVVVGWDSVVSHTDDSSKSLEPTYKLTNDKAAVDFTAEWIAPGVVRYQPKAGVRGALVLANGPASVGKFTRDGSDKNTLTAPVASAPDHLVTQGYRNERDVFSVAVTAVPDAALGVVLYDAKGVAISFSTVPHDKTTATRIDAFHDAGHCGFNPDGMHAPAAGAQVTLAWVDRFGRLSPKSKPVTVPASHK